jgi:hypothetical protein
MKSLRKRIGELLLLIYFFVCFPNHHPRVASVLTKIGDMVKT